MTASTIILGVELDSKTSADVLRIKNPKGEILQLKRSDVVSSEPIEVGGGLRRFILQSVCTVLVEVDGDALRELDDGDTILKWMDDGGTISKSRDDG